MDHCGPDGDQRDRRSLLTIVDQSGPATVMAEIVDEGTIVDQSGPATVMAAHTHTRTHAHTHTPLGTMIFLN